ncbi:MAG TPA: hypothetical protein PLV68_12690, partial [Ilumatobacteraceae bacterium]|nr:hypothetical protein [Ilumatobacteraceae bacterium]
AVCVAAWSMRLALSAQARGIEGISTGWAIAGWFVPIGFLFMGFRQVTKVVAGAGGYVGRVYSWQLAFAATAVVMTVAQTTSSDIAAVATDAAVSALTREAALSTASTVLFAAAALFAGRAITHADAQVSALPLA